MYSSVLLRCLIPLFFYCPSPTYPTFSLPVLLSLSLPPTPLPPSLTPPYSISLQPAAITWRPGQRFSRCPLDQEFEDGGISRGRGSSGAAPAPVNRRISRPHRNSSAPFRVTAGLSSGSRAPKVVPDVGPSRELGFLPSVEEDPDGVQGGISINPVIGFSSVSVPRSGGQRWGSIL